MAAVSPRTCREITQVGAGSFGRDSGKVLACNRDRADNRSHSDSSGKTLRTPHDIIERRFAIRLSANQKIERQPHHFTFRIVAD